VEDLVLKAEAPPVRAWHHRAMSKMFGRPDAAIAVAILLLGLLEALAIAEAAPIWAQVPLTFVWAVPLIWRRRWPVAVLALVVVMGPTLGLVNTQGGVISFVLAAILAAYTVGRELDPPRTWWGPALTIGFNWVAFGAVGGELSDFVFVAILYGGAWAVGYTIRRRSLEVDELTRQADELLRDHTERERRAVEQERARIARELHDIVAHSISVITIQAQTVRHQLGPANEEQIEALRGIETTARQAMAEMRRMLGVLRVQNDPLELTPQPGLEQVSRLITEARAAGIEVKVTTEGRHTPVPAGISLTAYRVIQEALTNVRKHTGTSCAEVLVRYGADALEIQVDNDGPERSRASIEDMRSGGGHGLAGMRERVRLFGGEFSAGPQRAGGFRVHVSLPLTSKETADL
jgi:signal transduction histidine kinase